MEFANTAICEVNTCQSIRRLTTKNTTFELKLPFTVRRPIGFRTPPDQIPYAA